MLKLHDGSVWMVRVHVIWFTGDLPAVKKVNGVKGHNGKLSCQFCLIEGVWVEDSRHVHYQSRFRTPDGRMEERFDPATLELRTVETTLAT